MNLSSILTNDVNVNVKTERKPSLSGRMEAMKIDSNPELPGQLPSIGQQYDEWFASSLRRPSVSSESDRTSGSGSSTPSIPPIDLPGTIAPLSLKGPHEHRTSTRRLAMIHGHFGQGTPYPSPHASPVQKAKNWRGSSKPHQAKREQSTQPPKDPRKIQQAKIKATKEKAARGHLCVWLTDLQNCMVKMNPLIPFESPGGEGRGWKELKSNNIHKGIPNAMKYNKTDLLSSSVEFMEQDMELLEAAIERLKSLGDTGYAQELENAVRKRATRFYDHPPNPKSTLRPSYGSKL